MTYLKTPGFVPATSQSDQNVADGLGRYVNKQDAQGNNRTFYESTGGSYDSGRAPINNNIGSIESNAGVARGQGTFTPQSQNTSTGLSLQQSAYNSGQRSRDLLTAQTNEKARFINGISADRGVDFFAGGTPGNVGTVTARQRRQTAIDNGQGTGTDYTRRGGNLSGGFETESAAGAGARIDTGAFAFNKTPQTTPVAPQTTAPPTTGVDVNDVRSAEAKVAQNTADTAAQKEQYQESERARFTANIDFQNE